MQLNAGAVTLERVTSAQEMYEVCHRYFKDVDVAIAAAAVADYKPKNVAVQKIKKSDATFTIELEKTKDILASLGEIKEQQFLIGFALETENEIEQCQAENSEKKPRFDCFKFFKRFRSRIW